MKNILRAMIIFIIIMLLFIPNTVAAAQNDLQISNLVILKDQKIIEQGNENVTVVLGTADIQTDLEGSLVVIFGKAVIEGNIKGDVVSAFGEVSLKNNSEITGNVVSVGKLEKASGASIKGTKLLIDVDFISLFRSNGILINTLIICSLFVLIAGLLLITIFPAKYRVMSYSLRKISYRRILLGILVVVSMTIVLAFTIFTIVAPVAYMLISMFADIIASIYLGTLIFGNSNQRSAIYLEFFVGQLIISILKIVPLIIIPDGSYTALLVYGICFIVLELVTVSLGIGTIILTGFGKKANAKLVRLNK